MLSSSVKVVRSSSVSSVHCELKLMLSGICLCFHVPPKEFFESLVVFSGLIIKIYKILANNLKDRKTVKIMKKKIEKVIF